MKNPEDPLADLEALTAVIISYLKFLRRGQWRLALSPLRLVRAMFALEKARKLPTPQERRRQSSRVIGQLAFAPEEQSTPYFQIAVADHSLAALTEFAAQVRPVVDPEQLLKVHELRGARFEKVKLSKVTGAVIGAGALVLKTVPDPVVLQLGLDLNRFKIVVFWLTVGAVAYVASVFGSAIWTERFTREAQGLLTDVLKYWAVLRKLNWSPPSLPAASDHPPSP